MKKDQNARLPILDSVARINSYGIEVVSGIILGLDTDTIDTADRILPCVDDRLSLSAGSPSPCFILQISDRVCPAIGLFTSQSRS